MKALYKLNNLLSIEVEADDQCALLEQISEIDESLRPEKCGKCDSDYTMPQSRKVVSDGDVNTYYEISCRMCGAVLRLGKEKDTGKLYKKRYVTDNKGKAVKDDDGKARYLPNRGWQKWNPETKKME